MSDPFSNLADATPEFVETIVNGLEIRASDPTMVDAVAQYIRALPASELSQVVEVGAGSGPVSRQIAKLLPDARVVGIEPSAEILKHARRLADGIENVTFEVGEGGSLPLDDGVADLVVQHTLLSHVADPVAILKEAARVLRPGGHLVVFDGDFAKGSLQNFPGDPFQAIAEYFALNFVTDHTIAGRLSELAASAGFEVGNFWITPRVVRDNDGMLAWIVLSTDMMVASGQIGEALAEGLKQEYARRRDAGTLYGFQAYATLLARRPA